MRARRRGIPLSVWQARLTSSHEGEQAVILSTIYVRFFRSFNFDYLRQDKDQVEPYPWDGLVEDSEAFYPFVRVDLERDITTVVGANEAGKSQLITAIQCLLGDRDINPRDFCRYSAFFGVRGQLPLPEFGGRFSSLTDSEQLAVTTVISAEPGSIPEFWVFKFPRGTMLYYRKEGVFVEHALDDQQVEALQLPRARRIDADVALPASVSLYDLLSGATVPHVRDRVSWHSIHNNLKQNEDQYVINGTQVADLMPQLGTQTAEEAKSAAKSLALVRDLFEKVAGVDRKTFSELLEAGGADDGYSSALTESMSEAVAVSLNFQQWWTQDKDFALEVHRDGFYLVLTMRDRTGQRYTFDERSGGMKYFLSYFIQYQAYQALESGRSEILLMDEPDAFLSSQGQQDLLRVLRSYAYPDSDKPAAQVLYVTHSPFLIDKNHPERIRVLQKGYGEEGTRVVAKAATDKYEPLRSAFGSFHADTAFIGTCNLLVEGPADLVLFSGVSAAMRKMGHEGANLNLNTLTMVPVHGASQYRYTLHLTRGRDLDRPAVIVLLDSDPAGADARKNLEKGYGTDAILDEALIVSIGDLNSSGILLDVDELHEPEDLIPAAAGLAAVAHFARQVLPPEDAEEVAAGLPADLKIVRTQRIYDQMNKSALNASQRLGRPLNIGKIEFARALTDVIPTLDGEVRAALFENFSALFHELNVRQDQALRLSNQDRLVDLTRRLVARFRRDHRTRVRKHTVERFLLEVEQHLEGASREEEVLRAVIRSLRSDFKLDVQPLSDVEDFSELKDRLGDLVYSPTRELERNT